MTTWLVSDAAAIREAAARANLALGSVATQDSDDIDITGGSIVGLDTLGIPPAIAPVWTGLHSFAAGIALADTPSVPVSAAVNPWFIDDSISMATIYATAASATEPETGLQIFMTSDLGFGGSPEPFKVAFFGVNHALPGAPSSYMLNAVLDIEPGVGTINGIVCELDINVRHADVGDGTGEPTFPFVTPLYIAHGGSRRAGPAITIQLTSTGTGDEPFNHGIAFVGGAFRQHAIGDWSDSESGLYMAGTKDVGIDLRDGTFSSYLIAADNFLLEPDGDITDGEWKAGVIAGLYGGTGVANSGKTITLGGNITTAAAFATSGANSLTLTTTGSTNVTLPTSGTLVNSTVTTLSNLASIGTITTGVWNGTDIAVADGGTGASTATAAIANLGYSSGAYTPTITNVSNLAASTAYTAYWTRWSDRVWVWGRFDLDPTAAGPTQTTVRISLPVASNIGAAEDLSGPANCVTVVQSGGIWGDATNNAAELNYIATNAGNAPFTFAFSYRVI